jgi:transcriptional regulator with XRE-family HTH domain
LSPRPKHPLVPHDVVGSRVRQFRRRAGLTQAALANEIGSDQASIANVEKGRRGISVTQLLRLCRVMGVSPSELLAERPPSPAPLEDRRLLRRLQKAQGLSRRQKLALLKLLDEFFKRAK